MELEGHKTFCDVCDEYGSWSACAVMLIDEAAKSGCYWCDLTVKILRHHYSDVRKKHSVGYYDKNLKQWSLQVDRGAARSMRLQLSETGNHNDRLIDIELVTAPKDQTFLRVHSASTLRHISDSTGSDQAVAWVRGHIDQCMKYHAGCSRASSKLPTRVLCIDGPTNVKLHIPSGEKSPYVCLSHCWGAADMIKTTSQTLDRYRTGITWAELPKTFRQAVSFAYRLGYKYIWIDSLCIIQDSREDWRHEGSRMAEIYANSTLTLSAAHSSDSRGGCFVTTPYRLSQTRWSLVDQATNEEYELYSRVDSIGHGHFIGRSLPLLTRGWALQERLLSPRVVHFTVSELVWECIEEFTCECSLINEIDLWRGVIKEEIQPRLWSQRSLSELSRCWHLIVDSYTALCLTFPMDIFPALQGFVKAMPAQLGTYLAGLWSETLVSDLSWMKPKSSPRPEKWRAPTWSWASTTCEVLWMSGDSKKSRDFVEIVDAKTVAKGHDPTGELLSGVLILRGRCVYGRLLPATSEQQSRTGDSQGCTATINFEGNHGRISYNNELYSRDERVFWDYNFEEAGPAFRESGSVAIALKLDEFIVEAAIDHTHEDTQYYTDEGVEYCKANWLILVQSTADQTAYERIGLLRTGGELDSMYEKSPEMDFKII
ncbi:heterokaryon incompatibility protein-domain-containing protein [Paraphoma chrysanthemicola]|nr:heterokaryon incompatibility protein-domain-containing protein [Paraphoma chrysanthemicola]